MKGKGIHLIKGKIFHTIGKGIHVNGKEFLQ